MGGGGAALQSGGQEETNTQLADLQRLIRQQKHETLQTPNHKPSMEKTCKAGCLVDMGHAPLQNFTKPIGTTSQQTSITVP